jgi:hypothetical protein
MHQRLLLKLQQMWVITTTPLAQATINLKLEPNTRSKVSITLDLPPELESELYTEASQLNLPLSEYILRILSTRQVLANPPKTGAELVAYWQSEGIINSRPEIADSQAYARKLRHEAETRERS